MVSEKCIPPRDYAKKFSRILKKISMLQNHAKIFIESLEKYKNEKNLIEKLQSSGIPLKIF